MDKDGVSSANGTGNITDLHYAPSIKGWFQYWITGGSVSTTSHTTYNTTGVISHALATNLLPGYTYNIRFISESVNGTTVGSTGTFTYTMPTVSTTSGSYSGGNYANVIGNVGNMGVATSAYYFTEYGTELSAAAPQNSIAGASRIFSSAGFHNETHVISGGI